MAKIFISYRKQGEVKPISLRLADDLRAALSEETVFRDEKGLKLGCFDDQLLHVVESCEAIIAVIGPTWIRRVQNLHNSEDWVRRELEVGIERGILLVPVLVDDASQPKESDLPVSLRALLSYQFTVIYTKHRDKDVGVFIDSLAEYLHLEKRDTDSAESMVIPNLSGN